MGLRPGDGPTVAFLASFRVEWYILLLGFVWFVGSSLGWSDFSRSLSFSLVHAPEDS